MFLEDRYVDMLPIRRRSPSNLEYTEYSVAGCFLLTSSVKKCLEGVIFNPATNLQRIVRLGSGTFGVPMGLTFVLRP